MNDSREIIIGEGSTYRAVFDPQIKTVKVYDLTTTEEIMRMSYDEWVKFTTPIYKEVDFRFPTGESG